MSIRTKTFCIVTDLCSAATKIQASFRGHQSRKEADKAQEVQAQKEKDLQEQQDKVGYCLHSGPS